LRIVTKHREGFTGEEEEALAVCVEDAVTAGQDKSGAVTLVSGGLLGWRSPFQRP
jgi:hypothetical protein